MSDHICTWPSCGHTAKGVCAPDRIVVDERFFNVAGETLYIRADLPPTYAAALALPKIAAMREAAEAIRSAVQPMRNDARGVPVAVHEACVAFDIALAAIEAAKGASNG